MSSGPSSFEIFVERYRKMYKTWTPVYCPALDTEVVFNSKGFKHLRFRVDGTPRNPKESIYKLRFLPLVRSVIYKAKSVGEYRKGKIEYWGISAKVGKKGNQTIKVILRRVGAGKVHFWSVMRI